jgi:hypothetical protein
LLEATERGLDLGIGCELAALGLRKPLQHGRKMRGIDLLRLSHMAAKGQHGERDFILTVRRQTSHGFQGFFEQFCHEAKIRSNRPKWKGMRQTSDLQRYASLQAGLADLSAVARRAKAEGAIRRLANADRRNTLRYSAGLMKTSRAQVDGDGPLLGETVVFTGKLQIARDAAASQASIAGADVADNVTKKTTILVVGDQYLRLTRGQTEKLEAKEG